LSVGRRARVRGVLATAAAGALLLAAPSYGDTFTVTNGTDTGSGSLRDAINQAETNNNDPTVDLIQITFTGNIDLASQLDISHPVTIDGPGAGNLDVRRDPAAPSGDQFGLFGITPPSGQTVTIRDLKVSGARAAVHSGAGVIMSGNGTLILDSVWIDDNQAPGGNGGGIYFDRGFTSIRNSAVTNNQADFGGGVMGSQFTPDVGNGEIVNSTIAGNSANDFGGGVYTNVSHIEILSSTIFGNVGGADDSGGGGGTENAGPDAESFSVANTLYAGNKVGTTSPVDDQCEGDHTSLGYNLRETSEVDCRGFTETTDSVDPDASLLDPLGSHGGPTPTIPLEAGNPAIDAGNPATLGGAFPACPATDQRGFLRGGAAGTCDIGAFEVGATEPPPAGGGGTTTPPPSSGPTGQRAAAIKKCKKKFPKGPKRKKCIKKAKKRFPV
jgi:hypothetical protein